MGLGDAPADVLSLSKASVCRLSERFSSNGEDLWADVRGLAAKFGESVPGTPGWSASWHHLLLAVGNFKRQGGTRLYPPQLSGLPTTSVPNEVIIPARPGAADLVCDGPGAVESWQRLMDGTEGLATATTTTLLAALWPAHHFVFDVRVRNAANGLRLLANQAPMDGVVAVSHRSPPTTLLRYEQVREWVLATASHLDVSVTHVERALYIADIDTGRVAGRSWTAYAAELAKVVR